jgi:hypothetical protein
MQILKKHPLSFVFSFLVFVNFGFSQGLKTELYLSPVLIQSNKVIETGTSIGEFNQENIKGYELGGRLKYAFKHNLGVGIGVNYKQIRYKFDYLLLEDNDHQIFLNFSRTNFTNHTFGINPTLFYEFKKLSFALSYEFNSIITSKGEILSNKDAVLGRPYASSSSYSLENNSYSVSEEARLGASSSFYSMPELVIGYKVSDKFTVFGGVKYKLLSDDVIYNLDVKANEGTTAFEEYNVQIINQPLFLQVGFSYDIIIK